MSGGRAALALLLCGLGSATGAGPPSRTTQPCEAFDVHALATRREGAHVGQTASVAADLVLQLTRKDGHAFDKDVAVRALLPPGLRVLPDGVGHAQSRQLNWDGLTGPVLPGGALDLKGGAIALDDPCSTQAAAPIVVTLRGPDGTECAASAELVSDSANAWDIPYSTSIYTYCTHIQTAPISHSQVFTGPSPSHCGAPRQLLQKQQLPAWGGSCLPLSLTRDLPKSNQVTTIRSLMLAWTVNGPKVRRFFRSANGSVAQVTFSAQDSGVAFAGSSYVFPPLRPRQGPTVLDGGRALVWSAVDFQANSKPSYRFKVKFNVQPCAPTRLRFLASLDPLDASCASPPPVQWTVRV